MMIYAGLQRFFFLFHLILWSHVWLLGADTNLGLSADCLLMFVLLKYEFTSDKFPEEKN